VLLKHFFTETESNMMSPTKPFVRISESDLKEKLQELQALIESDKSMPQNISEFFNYFSDIHMKND
jgi:hypothetical protein